MIPLVNTYRFASNHLISHSINFGVIRVFIALLLLLCLAPATASPTSAVINEIPQQSANQQDTLNAVIEPSVLIDDINKKLAETKSKLALLPSEAVAADDADIFANRLALKQLTFLYQGLLFRLENLQALKKNRIELQKQSENWTGFSEPSLHPFLRADELEDTVIRLSIKKEDLDSRMMVIDQAVEQVVNTVKDSTVKLRQTDELVEQAKASPEQQALLSRERERVALQNQINFARAIGAQIEKQTVVEDLLKTQAQLQLAKKQLSVASEQIALTQQDIDQVNKNIDIESSKITAEIKQGLAALNFDNTAKKPSNTDKATPAQFNDSKQLELVRQAEQNNADIKLQALNQMLVYQQMQRDMWNFRLVYAKVTDREKVNAAYDKIAKNMAILKTVHNYANMLRHQVLTHITEQSDLTANESDTQAIQKKLYLEQLVSYSRMLGTIESTQNLQERCKQELDKRFAVKSFSGYFEEALLATGDFVAQIWSFELFAAQDTIEVDGQKITGKRSITVDKVVTALAILIIGCWIAIRLARLVESLAVTRFGMDASLALIARRWILFAQVILLIVLSMLVVKIPLTVFAFMGGAVAIGAGFGMQNLLKNLISGLMLLFERPFRPGDLVEVGDIRGRVVDIGVRSSHIRDGNGIETLIPNSTFIEQNVTNWTLSNQTIRTVIKIGVAYGSPAREVADILLQVADQHGLVEKEPPPHVQFEDFGNDALIFGLYVWIELKSGVSWTVVASDLRYMINKTLTDEGIMFAFPQRDIHIDSSQPLEIRVIKDAPDKQDN